MCEAETEIWRREKHFKMKAISKEARARGAQPATVKAMQLFGMCKECDLVFQASGAVWRRDCGWIRVERDGPIGLLHHDGYSGEISKLESGGQVTGVFWKYKPRLTDGSGAGKVKGCV